MIIHVEWLGIIISGAKLKEHDEFIVEVILFRQKIDAIKLAELRKSLAQFPLFKSGIKEL